MTEKIMAKKNIFLHPNGRVQKRGHFNQPPSSVAHESGSPRAAGILAVVFLYQPVANPAKKSKSCSEKYEIEADFFPAGNLDRPARIFLLGCRAARLIRIYIAPDTPQLIY